MFYDCHLFHQWSLGNSELICIFYQRGMRIAIHQKNLAKYWNKTLCSSQGLESAYTPCYLLWGVIPGYAFNMAIQTRILLPKMFSGTRHNNVVSIDYTQRHIWVSECSDTARTPHASPFVGRSYSSSSRTS